MITKHIANAWFNTVFLALTPSDRWAAAKNLNTDSVVPGWFIWSVGITLIVLVALVLAITYKQRYQRARHSK